MKLCSCDKHDTTAPTWDNNKKVAYWTSNNVSSEKIKPFGTNLALILANLTNDRVSLKFVNFVLV